MPDTPTGALDGAGTARRGRLRAGDRVQLTDAKGKMHTITLAAGAAFHTHRGLIHHDELIGRSDGLVVETSDGHEYQVIRPLYSDFVLSMPRGATIVYPKDAAQIVMWADIHPGARVLEAGVGSGGLTIALLRAVGTEGSVHSIERREDFGDVARGNIENFFGAPHPAWSLTVGDFQDVAPTLPGTVDRVVLDMLAPWECVDAVADVLEPGGVVLMYVATVTQLSRCAEALRRHGCFTEPNAWESFVRPWHLEGLAVRPEHRMNAHTGFLLTARRLADGARPLTRSRRPAPGAESPGELSHPDNEGFGGFRREWTEEEMGVRGVASKKIRRALRDQGRRPAVDGSRPADRPQDDPDRPADRPQDDSGRPADRPQGDHDVIGHDHGIDTGTDTGTGGGEEHAP